MPAAKTYLATYDSVRRAADAALNSTDGVTVYFRVGKYGSAEGALTASRSFQTSFSAFRARARRLTERRTGEMMLRDVSVRGPYDKLVCQRLPLPDGSWSVSLVPSDIMLDGLDIVDNASGQPLASIGAAREERSKLWGKAIHKPHEFTAQDWDALYALEAKAFPDRPNDMAAYMPRPDGPPSLPHATPTPHAEEIELEGVEDMLDEGLDFAEE